MRYLLCGFVIGLVGCTEAPPDISPKLEIMKKILREGNESIRDAQEHTTAAVADNSETLREIKQKISELNSTVASKIPAPNAAQTAVEPAKSEETPASKLPDDPAPPEVVSVKSAGVPLFVSTTVPCAPCERLKRDHAAGMFTGFNVQFATDWAPRSYPAIRYPTKASSTGWAVLYGYDGQPTIDKLKELTSEKTVLAAQPIQVIQAPAAMSYSDMVSLHNRLHGGGSWTWPGDLSQHLQQAHGVSTGGFGYGSASYPPANSYGSKRYDFRSISRGNGYRVRNRYSARSSFCPTCPGS
jgi:hypothetical protein